MALLELGEWYVISRELEKSFDVLRTMTDYGYLKAEKLRTQIQEKLELNEDQKYEFTCIIFFNNKCCHLQEIA